MKKITFLLFLFVSGIMNVNAQMDQAVIKVAGKATVKEYPKEIVFRIPLKIIDDTYMSSNERLANTFNEFQKDLKNKGIAKELIHTDNYSITENMIFEGGNRIQKGFKGSVNVMLKDDFTPDLMHKVLESVSQFKLNYSINFSMSEDQRNHLTEMAMTSAIEDAKQKALVLAKAAHVELGSIKSISYGVDQYRPEPFLTERVLSNASDATGQNQLNLSPPLISLFKSVLIVWEIK